MASLNIGGDKNIKVDEVALSRLEVQHIMNTNIVLFVE